MIEELKLVLDSLGDLSGIGLWVVAFFIAWKLVIYLSTAGATVYCFKLLMEVSDKIFNKPKPAKFGRLIIDEKTTLALELFLKENMSTLYLHESDVKKMSTRIKFAKENGE